jgi:hypothetical protein
MSRETTVVLGDKQNNTSYLYIWKVKKRDHIID